MGAQLLEIHHLIKHISQRIEIERIKLIGRKSDARTCGQALGHVLSRRHKRIGGSERVGRTQRAVEALAPETARCGRVQLAKRIVRTRQTDLAP